MRALESKVVALTGAGHGIGRASALEAARHGASVVVNDVRSGTAAEVADAIDERGGSARAHEGDVSSWDDARDLVDLAVSEFGRLDGFVNNAGINLIGAAPDQDEAVWRKTIEVNLLGAAFCGTHAMRQMLTQGEGGSIVNITSGASTGFASMAAYGASKGGVSSLTYCWARDLEETGIRVNGVSPQADTRRSLAAGAEYRAEYPLPAPETNAGVVVYLLSDLAQHVNGQIVRIDGGTRLSLMLHPAVLAPVLENESWSVELVAATFAHELAERQLPLGLATVAVESITDVGTL